MKLLALLAGTSIALVPVTTPALAFTTVGGCPPGSFQELVTYTDTFGPEIGNWDNEVLSVPKYVGEVDATLIQVVVEICGHITGSAQFQNLDDDACLLTYEVGATATVTPQDPASPVADFVVAASTMGGPFPLAPGEAGSDAFDSGLECSPVQRFTRPTQVAFFVASPGDQDVIFDHSGVTSSQHFGCGVIQFGTTIYSELELRVTYVLCRRNYPPTCVIEPVPVTPCRGNTTGILLDASKSSDRNGTTLHFIWHTNCPGASFDDPTSVTPILLVDTSNDCDVSCVVQLRVTDGSNTVGCTEDIVIVP